LNIAGIWNVIGNSITMVSTDVTAQETFLTTMGGDLIIENGSANLGDVEVSSKNDVLITDWFLNVLGTLNIDSVNDLLVLGSNIKAADTTLNAASDLTIGGGTAEFGNASLNSGNDLSMTDWDSNIAGTLDANAANDLSVLGSNIKAAGTTLNAANDLTIGGGTADFGNASLNSGNNLSMIDWLLDVAGILNVNTENDLSVTNSHLTGGDMLMSTTNGDLMINGGMFNLKNALLTSGNDVIVSDVPQFDIEGYFGIIADNRLTLQNVTGKVDIADFLAKRYTLTRWSIYSNEMWLSGIDIYNDPMYLNSLVYDRIIRFNTQDTEDAEEDEGDEGDEEDALPTIGGSWLSVRVDSPQMFDEANPLIVPIIDDPVIPLVQ